MSLHLLAKKASLDIPSAASVLQALPFAAYTTDADGCITAFNEAAAQMWVGPIIFVLIQNELGPSGRDYTEIAHRNKKSSPVKPGAFDSTQLFDD